MKKLLLPILALTACACYAAEPAVQPTPPPDAAAERLWAGDAPGAKGTADVDIPTMAAYIPANAKKPMPAVVIFPGGGYGGLAAGHEGKDYALFLNQRGIAGFVVRYRLGSKGYKHPVMLHDAARAVRTVRFNAEKLGIDPAQIGVMGSSAGGHLAATIATKFDAGDANAADPVDKMSSRPDFAILCYPVITMGEFTHKGSRNNLLGQNPTPEQIKDLSAELNVTAQTPPSFVWHTYEDRGVVPQNSIDFARALVMNKVPVDLHIYEKGGHGMGLRAKYPYENAHPWTRDLEFWFKARKILP